MIVAPQNSFLAVDPGKAMGWALFDARGVLLTCGLTDGDRPTLPHVSLLVIERPHEGETKTKEGKVKAGKRDIVTLARRMGMAIGAVAPMRTVEVYPVQWKGTVPKVFVAPTGEKFYPAEKMIEGWMTTGDRATYDTCVAKIAKGKRNNVLDAVGIGIWYCRKVGLR